MTPDPELYRPNVGLAVFHPTGLVWLGKRAGQDGPYQWQLPQGGIDAGEAPREAAFRELQEETGIRASNVSLLEETDDWFYYDFPPDIRAKQRKRYLGQRQKWFAFRFLGKDSDIRLDEHTPEFSDWRWSTFDMAVDLVIPFKRAVYEAAARRFQRYAAGSST